MLAERKLVKRRKLQNPSEDRDMRKNDHDAKWTVFYIFTDLNSEVNGNLMDAHEMGEAYDLLGLPSVQYIERLGGKTR